MKVSKTFRLSEEVIAEVDKRKGKNLTDKLEELLWYCFQKLPSIERKIKEKNATLKRLEKEITKHQEIKDKLDIISQYVDTATRYCKEKKDVKKNG